MSMAIHLLLIPHRYAIWPAASFPCCCDFLSHCGPEKFSLFNLCLLFCWTNQKQSLLTVVPHHSLIFQVRFLIHSKTYAYFQEEACISHSLLFNPVIWEGSLWGRGIILVSSFRSFRPWSLGSTVSLLLYIDLFSSEQKHGSFVGQSSSSKWLGNRKSKRGIQWPSGGTSKYSLSHARPNLLLSTTFQSCRIMNLPVRLVPSWSNHKAYHFAHSFFSTSNWTSDLNDNKPEIRSTENHVWIRCPRFQITIVTDLLLHLSRAHVTWSFL